MINYFDDERDWPILGVAGVYVCDDVRYNNLVYGERASTEYGNLNVRVCLAHREMDGPYGLHFSIYALPGFNNYSSNYLNHSEIRLVGRGVTRQLAMVIPDYVAKTLHERGNFAKMNFVVPFWKLNTFFNKDIDEVAAVSCMMPGKDYVRGLVRFQSGIRAADEEDAYWLTNSFVRTSWGQKSIRADYRYEYEARHSLTHVRRQAWLENSMDWDALFLGGSTWTPPTVAVAESMPDSWHSEAVAHYYLNLKAHVDLPENRVQA